MKHESSLALLCEVGVEELKNKVTKRNESKEKREMKFSVPFIRTTLELKAIESLQHSVVFSSPPFHRYSRKYISSRVSEKKVYELRS